MRAKAAQGTYLNALVVFVWITTACNGRKHGEQDVLFSSPLSRSVEEDACTPLLRPHLPKVSLLEVLCQKIGVSFSAERAFSFFRLLLGSITQVALMFLVIGKIPHEEIWTSWIGNLAGVVPASIGCDPELERCYRDMQASTVPPKSVYDEQTFFNIVVHPKPRFEGYSSGSIFDGRIVEERTEVALLLLLL